MAFFSRGTINNAGTISADASGFRGGAYTVAPMVSTGCADLDQTAPLGGGKGEGVAAAAPSGRGDVGNAGGGGDCSRSGGAGGGNATLGGGGGTTETSDGSRSVGGIGGAPLTLSLLSRLVFGGGGGAGQGSSGDGAPGSAGGGVVFLRGVTLTGTGTLHARGGTYVDANGNPLSAGMDGGGGGGAGGSVYLRFSQGVTCGGIDVSGGAGSAISSEGHGPGGGGAGGRALLQAASGTCPVTLAGGAGGAAPSGAANGATAGGAGASETPPAGGYCAGALDCGGTTPACDVAQGVCVQCVGPGDCADPTKPVCETSAGSLQNQCTQCSQSSAALCTGATPVCQSDDTCGCTKNSECGSALPVCDPTSHTCVPYCLADTDCTAPPLLHCDNAASPPACVECVQDDQCPSGRVCSPANACVECTPDKAAACTTTGSGAVCLASGTCGCGKDSDCGDATSGRVCDMTAQACALGCRGTAGNGCTSGFVCSSTTDAIGTCGAPAVDAGVDAGQNDLLDSGRLGGGGAGCGVQGDAASTGGPVAAFLALWLGAALARGRRAGRRRVP